MIKNILYDFGYVLAYPKSGNWFIPPNARQILGIRNYLLIDTFHAVRTITTLLHPIAPSGCEIVREYLGLGEELWSWENIFEPLTILLKDVKAHKLKFLEPKIDFFKHHESQFDNDK